MPISDEHRGKRITRRTNQTTRNKSIAPSQQTTTKNDDFGENAPADCE